MRGRNLGGLCEIFLLENKSLVSERLLTARKGRQVSVADRGFLFIRKINGEDKIFETGIF